MKHHPVWLACVCAAAVFALPGCPGQRKPQLILPQQPDQYDQWAQGLQQEDAFYAELQRLQRLYADAPDLALAAPQAFDGQYTLKSRIEKQRAGLTLTDRDSSEQWTLWFLDGTGKDAPQIETTRDEASAGGYSIELSLGGKVSVTLVARWVQGRYLQLTRELTLNGMDQTAQAKAQYTEWTLDGPWLPYRMAPGLSGPYGVVLDAEADGAWHSRLYPVEAMVPAVAAYDRTHGFMLAVSDDHPRKLDRRYDLGYAIPKGLAPGAQIRCTYTSYDGTRDTFDRPWLASGLPLRDSVVLEPLKLVCKSADPTLVEAESAEVIQHVADFVHAYHFVPKPPALPEPGGIVRADQLRTLASRFGPKAALENGITQAVGPCGVKLCLVDTLVPTSEDAKKTKAKPSQAALPAVAGIGIDATGLPDGKDLTAEQIQQFQQLKQGGLSVLVETNIQKMRFVRHSETNFPDLQPGWFVDDDGWMFADRLAALKEGVSCGWPLAVQPNWHNPQANAWFTRKLVSDLARYPDVAGYSILVPQPIIYNPRIGSELKSPQIGSYEAHSAVFQLHLGEAVRAVRSDACLLSDSIPSLGMPSWCGILLPNESKIACPDDSDEHASISLPTHRLSTFLLNRVFNTQPYLTGEPAYLKYDRDPIYNDHRKPTYSDRPLTYNDNHDPVPWELASFVMRTAGTPNGMLFYPTGGVGFPDFATHQIELQAASGELRIVYSDPAKNAYTGGDERPAVCDKLIAILPGKWEGAQSVWVCFHGIGGSLRVDKYNYLSISWDGGGWTGKLPTGYWEIEHPSKGEDIQPGDAVLIKLKPIAPMLTPGKPLG